MQRASIVCKHCGGNDFEVNVNYCIPRAIQLECECGYITPIAFFDKKGKAYGVNSEMLHEVYERTFYEDIEPVEACEKEHQYYAIQKTE